MQIFARLKKALIIVRAEANQGSCTSQSKTRAQFSQLSSTIPSGYDRARTESGQVQTRFYWGLSEIRSGFGRDPFRLKAEFEHGSIQVKAKLNQGPCAIQAGCDWSLSETQT